MNQCTMRPPLPGPGFHGTVSSHPVALCLLATAQPTFLSVRRENLCLCGDVPPWLSPIMWSMNTSIGMLCANQPYECSPVLPTAWYQDNGPLLQLKVLLAPGQSTWALDTWTQYRPACTSTNSTGNCTACYYSDPQCGVPRASDGALLCNWRFISCRNRRVIGIHFGQQVGVNMAGD